MPSLGDVVGTGLRQIQRLVEQAYALFLLLKDPRTPWFARLVALLVLVYVLSPIDIIPDPLPFGLFDDAAVAALGLAGVRRLSPPALVADVDARAQALDRRARRYKILLVAVVVAWVVSLILLGVGLWWWFTH